MTYDDPNRTIQTIALPDANPNRSWLLNEHPYYTANKAKWEYVRDHYTGDLLEPKRIAKYLIRRITGEVDKVYEERCKLADYTPHFAECVEGLAGMLYAVEGDANRLFVDENKQGLGDPSDPSTPIGRLWQRANAEGHGYLTVMKQLMIELIHSHCAWLMVDPADGESQVFVVPALNVPNWSPDGTEAVIIESADARATIKDRPGTENQYLHVYPAGWQRYRIGSDGREIAIGEPGTWHFETPNGKPRIPVFSVKVPMKRAIGYQQARKANVIFNKESVRDMGQRVAGFQKLVLAANNTLYDKLETAIADSGANLLQEDPIESGGGHRYIGPDPAPATALNETIKQNVIDFKATFHKAYDDSAAQKTATEVRQDVGAGTGAFLQLLKSAADDGENGVLALLEQAEFPNDRRKWFIARVERSDDFMPADPDAVQEKSAKAAWGEGKAVPMGVTALESLALEIARQRGAEVNVDELKAHVRVRAIIDMLESAPTSGIELPAEVRAEIGMLIIMATGLIPKDATEQMEDGTKKPKLDLIRQQMIQLTKAADEQKKRDAELLAGGGGGNDDSGNEE